jgi:hypothetical protein
MIPGIIASQITEVALVKTSTPDIVDESYIDFGTIMVY